MKPRPELKPCPFCGAGWKIVEHKIEFKREKEPIKETGWYINCNTGCNARTTNWHTKEQAIQAWNRRTNET